MHKKITTALLAIGAIFFAVEAVLHFFGLPILEHDKIFLPTHDRYIAIYAATYAALLILIATDTKKYARLFVIVMIGIAIGMANGFAIAHTGGYAYFHVVSLDSGVRVIGYSSLAWYIALLVAWHKSKNEKMA